MDRARWQRVEAIYHAALEKEPELRASFLAEVLGGDEELRSEVESLLALEGRQPRSFGFGKPAIPLIGPLPSELPPGTEIGPYIIEDLLGAGGMGKVYRAHDTRLGRHVAIKIAAGRFTDRFEREARAIAALNHPHVCTLHDIGPNYLVMELVEGQTLAARVKKGTIPAEEIRRYGVQIAGALAAAHAKGIVHRDLKPGNIMLTRTGAKVLDFGLAKAASDETLTMSNVVVGTPAYMAPEQRQGKPCDARTDIYALGLVLRAMAGEKAAPPLAAVIERCLAAEPDDRWQSAADLAIALELPAAAAPVPSRPVRSAVAWAIAAGLAIFAGVALWAPWRTPPPAPGMVRFQFPVTDLVGPVALSPDGTRIAYVDLIGPNRRVLWIRDLQTLEARALPGTEGTGNPVWSPDGKWIAFAAGRIVMKVDPDGGSPPEIIAEASVNVTVSAWSNSGVILLHRPGTGALRKVSEAGGPISDVTVLNVSRQDAVHGFVSFLPDGRHFLYYLNSSEPGHQGIYVGSLDVAPGQQDPRRLLATEYRAVYQASNRTSAGGYLLFVREGTLLAQPFDADRLELVGEPRPVGENVASANSFAYFSASGSSLAFREGTTVPGSQLTWVDRQGRPLTKVGGVATYTAGRNTTMRLSPNGATLAVQMAPRAHTALVDVERGVLNRLTPEFTGGVSAVWSPDGSRVAFAGDALGTYDLYQIPSDGSGTAEVILRSDLPKYPTSWSPDGRFLLYFSESSKTQGDLWALTMDSSHRQIPLLKTNFNERQAVFSPDGRWIAFTSDESGRDEVYVMPFREQGSAAGAVPKVRISVDGGTLPEWRGDGKEIYFRSLNRTVMAVDIATGEDVRPGIPAPLFALAPCCSDWTADRDGRRFLVSIPDLSEALRGTSITMVLNWETALAGR